MTQYINNIIKTALGRLTLTALPLFAACAFTACSGDDNIVGDEPSPAGKQSPLAFNVSVDGQWDDATRGVPVNRLTDPLGIFVYKFQNTDDRNLISPDESLLNDLVSEGPSGWITSSTFGWPKDGKVLFFGYYPYQDDDDPDVIAQKANGTVPLTLPTTTSQGYMAIKFRTPDTALQQIDLMGAASYEMDGDPNENTAPESVTLKFHHLLAGVQFNTGSFSELGTIKKIVLNRVLRDGTVTFTPRSSSSDNDDTYTWAPVEGSFFSPSTEPNYVVAATETGGVTINPNENILLLMPQVLDANASIDLYYDNGAVQKLTTRSIAGKELYKGKITVFTLSVSSLQKLNVETTVIDWKSSGAAEEGSITDGDPVAPEAKVDNWTDGGNKTQNDMEPLTEYPSEY